MTEEKNNKTRNNILTILIIIGIIGLVGFIQYSKNKKKDNELDNIAKIKNVEVINLKLAKNSSESIKVVGKVEPDNKISIVASSKGTVRNAMFEIGDEVKQNQMLAFLSNDLTSTNLSNTQVNYFNMLNSLEIVKKSADDQVRQAENGVENARESVRLAEVSLQATQDNYNNNSDMQGKGKIDTKESAIISFYEFVNYTEDKLTKINYIIQAEPGEAYPGLQDVLAAKNSQTLSNAKNNYQITKNYLNQVKNLQPTQDSVTKDIREASKVLLELRTTISATIQALDNTLTGSNFTNAQLQAEQNKFNALFKEVVAMQNKADNMLNTLENLDLNSKSLLDSLASSQKSAESQLEMSKVSLDNALTALEQAKKGREQQILSAQISVDNSLSQLNVNREMYGDLTIKAPIEGVITAKSIDIGTEISPGQKVAEVSQTAKLKIEINLNSEDIYQIKVGDKVIINEKFEAEINSINPSADPVTRKVKAEIMFDNTKKDKLIPGTTVNVEIPVKNEGGVKEGRIFVPLKAVRITPSEKFVFIIVEEENIIKAKKIIVEIGETEGALIEIVSGLSGEEEIVIKGNRVLEDEEIIKIQE